MDVHPSYSSCPYLLPQISVLKKLTSVEVCRGSAKAENWNIGKNSSLITIYSIIYLQTFIVITGIIKLFGNKEQSEKTKYWIIACNGKKYIYALFAKYFRKSACEHLPEGRL